MDNREDDLSLRVTEQLMSGRYSTHSTSPLMTPYSPNRHPSSSSGHREPIRKPKSDQTLVWPQVKEKIEEEPPAWWILSKEDEDGFHSVGGLLFLFGFLFPPLWWLGSFWPKQAGEKGGKMAERWQRLNRAMSIGFSIILVILIIVFAALYATNK
ncbi:hypothetical protein G6F56_000566 [Rhizopus delemar]|nr:hypothetical protein G6F56_000566 [Rhizopus delemar]